MKNQIQHYMTPSPHTIASSATLQQARELMNRHHIRHLPVLEAGTLVGLLSQRDIQLLETLKDVDSREVPVEEAMSQDVLVAEPDAELAEVAGDMVESKCGSAVVTRSGDVLGIFTTIDALKALAESATDAGSKPHSTRVRARVRPAPDSPELNR